LRFFAVVLAADFATGFAPAPAFDPGSFLDALADAGLTWEVEPTP